MSCVVRPAFAVLASDAEQGINIQLISHRLRCMLTLSIARKHPLIEPQQLPSVLCGSLRNWQVFPDGMDVLSGDGRLQPAHISAEHLP